MVHSPGIPFRNVNKCNYGVGQKLDQIRSVDNLAMVDGRKAYQLNPCVGVVKIYVNYAKNI